MADELNFQLPRQGYDSYLYGIIPDDQAVLAGAFSISMQQIKNIQNIQPEIFAKVVYSIETNNGLPLTNGTNVPAQTFIVNSALSKVAIGSGLYGSYTHSDLIGSMTGLPYPLLDIYNGIKQLETNTLKTIYQNLYLAVKWEQATATWDGSNFTYTNRGGGYGRGAGAPSVTVGGNNATATIGTDPNDLDTFGKIISISYSGPAGAVVILAPPGPGWPNMNSVIQDYIDQANAEIEFIATVNDENFQRAKLLNTNWNALGTALKIEQRARYTAIPPVSIPRDPFLALYPTALYNFVDALPDLAANTMPHGPAQSLEMMADFCSVGGQSLIAMMRQERNQQRLSELGIPLDNNIPNTLSVEDQRKLIANGTKCGATEEGGITSDNGLSFPIPAFATTTDCEGQNIVPEKRVTYDNEGKSLRKYDSAIAGSLLPLLNNPGCDVVAGPQIPVGNSILLGTGIPSFLDVDINLEIFPGNTANILPDMLNIDFISATLLPSQYDVASAIDKVIECNCDCWIN